MKNKSYKKKLNSISIINSKTDSAQNNCLGCSFNVRAGK
jgi:hypothetical protein